MGNRIASGMKSRTQVQPPSHYRRANSRRSLLVLTWLYVASARALGFTDKLPVHPSGRKGMQGEGISGNLRGMRSLSIPFSRVSHLATIFLTRDEYTVALCLL